MVDKRHHSEMHIQYIIYLKKRYLVYKVWLPVRADSRE